MAANRRGVVRQAASLLFIISLPSAVFASPQGRDLATVDDAETTQTSGGLSPRFYLPAISAMPPLLGGEWWRRQDGIEPINCWPGNHSCLDVAPEGAEKCCPDNRYCFMNQDMEIKCCAAGNVCSEQTPCTSGENYCHYTKTITSTITAPPDLSSGAAATGTNSVAPESSIFVTYETQPACCNRRCGTASFGCPEAFGGQCCPVGFRCGTSGLCLIDVTSTPPPVANPVPSGCTATWQFACAESEGGGCCDIGQTCASGHMCDGERAPTITASDGSVIVAEESGGGGGLSSGAKVGIGVGVGAGAASVIGGLTYCCLGRRTATASRTRESKELMTTGVGPDGGGGGEQGVNTITNNDGTGYNSNSNTNTGSGPRGMRGRLMGPLSPAAQFFRRGASGGGVGSGADSELSGPTSAGGFGTGSGSGTSRPPLHQTRSAYDYLGPQAVPGPYTETADAPATALPERQTGVVGGPHGPDDIVPPVEIDSSHAGNSANGADGGVMGAGGKSEEKVLGLNDQFRADAPSGKKGEAKRGGRGGEDEDGPFELVGSPTPGSPSPPRSPVDDPNGPGARSPGLGS